MSVERKIKVSLINQSENSLPTSLQEDQDQIVPGTYESLNNKSYVPFPKVKPK